MKQIRQWYWFLSSMMKRYFWVILISTTLGVLMTFNFNTIIQIIPKSKTVYIGRVGGYTLEQLPRDIQNLVSSGLTVVGSEGVAEPGVAKSWQVENDGKLYRFYIDPESKWNDGETVQSSDIDLRFQDVEVSRNNENEITFTLSEPFVPFPIVLSQPLFKRQTARSFLFFKKTYIIGTGEFVIDELKITNGVIAEMRLTSDEERRVYRFFNSEEEAITAFKQGRVDRLEDLSHPRDLNDWKNVTIEKSVETDQYVAVFFDTTNQALSSKAVRQAMAYAIPKTTVPNLRALGPISPTSFAYNPQVKAYDFDLSQAKELLTGEFPENEPLPELEISTTTAYTDLAEKIKTSWEQLGFPVKLKIINFPDVSNYQVLVIGQKVPDDPDQYNLWHSTQVSNFTHYNSPRVDKLLEDGRKTLDLDERTLIYQDFQRFLLEDVPAVFLEYLESYTVSRN